MKTTHKESSKLIQRGYFWQMMLYIALLALGFYFYKLDLQNYIAFQQDDTTSRAIVNEAQIYYYICIAIVLLYSTVFIGYQLVVLKVIPNSLFNLLTVGLVVYLCNSIYYINTTSIRDNMVVVIMASLAQIAVCYWEYRKMAYPPNQEDLLDDWMEENKII